jgi:tetratricopeptide (TPR) repeat protein
MSAREGEVTRWFTAALHAFAAAHDDQAFVAHEQVKRLEPGGSADLLLTGLALLAGGRFAAALAVIEGALALAPGCVLAWTLRGLALRLLGQVSAAPFSYQQALRIDPQHPLALDQLGETLLQLGRFEEAQDCFERLLARRGTASFGLAGKVAALCRRAHFEEALSGVEDLLRLVPNSGRVHLCRGMILTQLGRFAAALASAEQAIACDGGDPDAWSLKGEALERLHRQEEAQWAWQLARALEGDGHASAGERTRVLALLRHIAAVEMWARSPQVPAAPRRWARLPARGTSWLSAVAAALLALAILLLAWRSVPWLVEVPPCAALLHPLDLLVLACYPLALWHAWSSHRGSLSRLASRVLTTGFVYAMAASALLDVLTLWRVPLTHIDLFTQRLAQAFTLAVPLQLGALALVWLARAAAHVHARRRCRSKRR